MKIKFSWVQIYYPYERNNMYAIYDTFEKYAGKWFEATVHPDEKDCDPFSFEIGEAPKRYTFDTNAKMYLHVPEEKGDAHKVVIPSTDGKHYILAWGLSDDELVLDTATMKEVSLEFIKELLAQRKRVDG